MTPAETQILLSMAAAYDNRKPDPDAAKAWAAALDGLRFDDCREALIGHYRESRDWLMPVDIRRRVKRLRSERVKAFGTLPDPPPSLDPDNPEAYREWLTETTERIADGAIRPGDQPHHRGLTTRPGLRALVAQATPKETP